MCVIIRQFKFIIFAETPQSVEKQDFFFKDFIYGTIITGSWINEVGEFAESWRKTQYSIVFRLIGPLLFLLLQALHPLADPLTIRTGKLCCHLTSLSIQV